MPSSRPSPPPSSAPRTCSPATCSPRTTPNPLWRYPMLSDEQFGEGLGARLRSETTDLEPGWSAATLRRRHARHVATVRAAVLAPALVAVVATALVAVGGTGR